MDDICNSGQARIAEDYYYSPPFQDGSQPPGSASANWLVSAFPTEWGGAEERRPERTLNSHFGESFLQEGFYLKGAADVKLDRKEHHAEVASYCPLRTCVTC